MQIDGLEFIVMLVTVLAIGVGQLMRKRRLSHPTTTNSPVLFAQATSEATDLICGYQGSTPSGMQFTYNITGMSLFSNEQTMGVYSVELPFMSGVHLLGCAKHSDTQVDIHTSGSVMERVNLEGNYDDYFTLYADTGQQVQSRYVLDPAAMVFTIDFCRQFNWEIIEDTLYFMNQGHLPSFEIVDQFVAQIRPAVEVPSDRRKNPYRMSYTNFSGRTMLCPICQKQLLEGDQWLECPDGHGSLVTGGQLIEMREGDGDDAAVRAYDTGANVTDHAKIACPYCGSEMVPSHYQSTETIIDVCTKCMFRWLDSGELKRIVQ